MAAAGALSRTAVARGRVKPKVLVLHNHYHLPGGEDAVFAAESALLEANGHEVVRLTVHNDDLTGRSRAGMAAETIWNRREYTRVREVLQTVKPSVMHCHNTFPQFSPAVYYAARSLGVPVVQTLHNFRITCVNGLLFRDGKPCDKCVGSAAPWRGAVHACYRGDRGASAVAVAMIGAHKMIRTYTRAVDCFIALTEFARARFIASGLPAHRTVVKPNFARDRGTSIADSTRSGFLYVGRLSEEKGIALLIEAARLMTSDATITIVGDGPLRDVVERAAAEIPRLRFVGACTADAVHAHKSAATAVVIPSLCYEMFPVVAAEAFGAGTPVIASAHGALTSIVEDGVTGRLFTSGDATALARALDALTTTPELARRIGAGARARYDREFSPVANYAQLSSIYESVLAARLVRLA
jgi:glycosyltransferase involved in cell wall biosynthesis